MEALEQTRVDALYAQHLRALKPQGKADATVDGYASGTTCSRLF